MATKGVHKAVDGVKWWFFGKKSQSPQEKMRKDQGTLADTRKSAGDMIAKLKCISLKDRRNKLPQSVIEEAGFQNVIDWAIEQLIEPTVITRDISKLDEIIMSYIDTLDEAVKKGWLTTAQWAATAIYQALSNLRQEISGVELTNADELYEKRLNYAIEMANVVKLSRDYDVANDALKEFQGRFDKKNIQIQELKKTLYNLGNTLEGAKLMEEIRQKAHNPATLSKEAMKLRQQYEDYHILVGSTMEISLAILVKTSIINNCNQLIETARNHLAENPTVNDPMLRAQIERANEIYLKNINKTLDDLEASRKNYSRYLSKIEETLNHPMLQAGMARVVSTMQDLENQKRDEMEAEIRNAKIVNGRLQRMSLRNQELERLKNEKNILEAENQTVHEENTEDQNDDEEDNNINVEDELE